MTWIHGHLLYFTLLCCFFFLVGVFLSANVCDVNCILGANLGMRSFGLVLSCEGLLGADFMRIFMRI